MKVESNPNVNWRLFSFLPSAWGHLYAACPARLERAKTKAFASTSLLWCNKGSALVRGLSHRQDMAANVVLTVNSGDEVLKGAAVQRQSSRPLPLLVLLNSLQDKLFLEGWNTVNGLHWMQVHCLCTWSHAWRHEHNPTNTWVHISVSQS